MMVAEHKCVVVVRDIADVNLMIGDVGVIVHIHYDANKRPIGYILETFSVVGESLGTVSVGLNDVRLASSTDRMHARVAA